MSECAVNRNISSGLWLKTVFAHNSQALFTVFVIIVLVILRNGRSGTCERKNYAKLFIFLMDQVIALYIIIR